MIYVPYATVAIWLGGYLFLCARAFNDGRILLNNLAPGENYWGEHWRHRHRFSITSMDPARFNDAGRLYLKKAIQNQRIMAPWAIGGLILNVCLIAYLKAW